MSERPSTLVPRHELMAALEAGLSRHFSRTQTIRKMKRRLSAYCSSYHIENLDVTLDDGRLLQLVFKDVSADALIPDCRTVKPEFLYNPLREIECYRDLLAGHSLGTPIFYGAVTDGERGRHWLFLERVPPTMLWQIGDFEIWKSAARWLAVMHTHFAGIDAERAPYLLHYDEAFCWRWMHRAQKFLCANDRPADGNAAASINWLAGRYGTVVEKMIRHPHVFIHGEFYPANVMVNSDEDGTRLCPLDWEMAAIGPALIDVAALSSGNWSAPEKKALALAYLEALPTLPDAWRDEKEFLTDLEFCRLHQAVQLLGWAPHWSPPPEHHRNWLAIAIRIAEELGL